MLQSNFNYKKTPQNPKPKTNKKPPCWLSDVSEDTWGVLQYEMAHCILP